MRTMAEISLKEALETMSLTGEDGFKRFLEPLGAIQW
jgi:hypothetical protein